MTDHDDHDEDDEARQHGPRGVPARARLHGDVAACTAPPTSARASRTIHAALERGVTLLDTGDFYGMGHNELLVGRALARPPRPGAAAR